MKSQIAMNKTCADVRVQVEALMTEVLKLYQYGCVRSPIVAFTCPNCDFGSVTPHYATLLSEDMIQCTHTQNCFDVPPKLKHWMLVS